MNLAEDISRTVDIVDYIQRFLPLRKSGSNRVGSCPFHKEKSPSFMVSDSKGIYKCFGCGKGGDIISFVMEYERIDFVDALKYLAEYAHIPMENYPKIHSDGNKHTKDQLKSLNIRASNYFHSKLLNTPSALAYLEGRKLDSQIISTFQLGYADESYYDLTNYLKQHDFSQQESIDSGLIKQGTTGDVYDFFRKRIIFPIWDQIGNIVGFTGRIIDPNDNPKYLNISANSLYDKSKALYGINFVKKHIPEFGIIIVVEGNMDVIALHRIGLPIGVATCGTSLTHDHIKLLKRHTNKVYFCFDNDDAGFSATVRGLKLAFEQDLYPQAIQLQLITHLGKIKDIDDLANAGGNQDDLLSVTIDALEFVIQHLKKKYNQNNPVDLKQSLDTLFEIIRSIQDLSITQHYINIVAGYYDISAQTLLGQYKNRYKKARFEQPRKNDQEHKSTIDQSKLLLVLLDDEAKNLIQYSNNTLSALELYKKLLGYIGNSENNIQDKSSYLLRREQELQSMDLAKKDQFIQQLCLKQCDEILKGILKTSALHNDEKTQLIQERKSIQAS